MVFCSASIECANAGLATLLERAAPCCSRSIRSLPAPGAAHERAQVGDRRARVAHERAQLAEERREVLRRRLGRGDERRRGRRASRAGSRTSCCALRSVSGRSPSASVERRVLVADRRRGRVRVGDEVREVVAALGQRRRRSSRALTQEGARSVCWSRTSSLTSRREASSAGLKYLRRLRWPARRGRRTASREPWMTCCSALRVFGSSVLKSWSRSTVDVVLSVPSVAPSSSLRRWVRRPASARCSGWRCPTARSRGSIAVVPSCSGAKSLCRPRS